MIDVTGMLLPDDYVRAQYLHLRPRLAFKILGVLIVFAALWAIWYSMSKGGLIGPGWIDYLFFAAIVYLCLSFFVYLPWKTRRTYRQQKSLQRESRMMFDEAGIVVDNELGHATVPWSDYVKWKENDHLFLLYVSDPVFHVLPKRYFSGADEVEKLRQILQAKIGSSAA